MASKSLLGFLGNIKKSGIKNTGDIASSLINILNPDLSKNTIANLGRVGLGAGELIIPGEQGHEKYARSVGDFYSQRYGVGDLLKGNLKGAASKVGNTLYEDPVGSALDLSAILTGGGSLAKGLGSISKSSKLSGVGKAMTTASAAIDPYQALGKVLGPRISKITGKTGEMVENVGKDISGHALRPSNSQMSKFEEVSGRPIQSYISEKKLYGTGKVAAKKADDLIKPLQNEYNSLVRSGEKVDPTIYIQSLKQKAKEIRDSDFSLEASKVANDLDMRAENISKKVTKNGRIEKIPIDILTETKSSSFSKVPGGVMGDPTSLHGAKIAGEVGIEVLDKLFPGSAQKGKHLQELRTFKEIAEKQGNLGKGNQLFNLLKPSGGGATIGGILGLGLGNPLLGSLLGAGFGEAASNPSVLSATSKGFRDVGKNLQSLSNKSIPLPKISEVGNVSRALTPIEMSKNSNKNQGSYNDHGVEQHNSQSIQSPVNGAQSSTSGQEPILSPGGEWRFDEQVGDWVPNAPVEQQKQAQGGFTKEQIQQAMLMDLQSTGGRNLEKLEKFAKFVLPEEKSQKSPSAASLQVKGKASSGLSALDEIGQQLEQDPHVLLKSMIPGSPGARQFEAAMSSIIDAIGGLRTGASVSKEQQKYYRNFLPKFGDSPETIAKKIYNVRKELQVYLQGSEEIVDPIQQAVQMQI